MVGECQQIAGGWRWRGGYYDPCPGTSSVLLSASLEDNLCCSYRTRTYNLDLGKRKEMLVTDVKDKLNCATYLHGPKVLQWPKEKEEAAVEINVEGCDALLKCC
jgi:hypothetical protein